MIGQQRNRLATLGIDVWIPRNVACQNYTAPSIWRDQGIAAEQLATEVIQFNIASTPTQTVKTITAQVPTTDVIKEKPASQEVIATAPVIPKDDLAVEKVQAFELQMHILEHCVILLESSQFTQEQQQLWHNIQKAKKGQYAELQWPFPFAAFQDSRGLASYIQGFFDVMAADKKILCLGKLSFIQHPNILHLASIEEMLAQPILKRRLWQLMK